MMASIKALIVAALICGAGAARVRRARARGLGPGGAAGAAASAPAPAPLQLLQLRAAELAYLGSNAIEEVEGARAGARAGAAAGADGAALTPRAAAGGLTLLGLSLESDGGTSSVASKTSKPDSDPLPPLCDVMWCACLLTLLASPGTRARTHAARAPPRPARSASRRPAVPLVETVQKQPPVRPAVWPQDGAVLPQKLEEGQAAGCHVQETMQ
jgi:hypothetical protein